MSKTVMSPALAGTSEIIPSLPLHDPSNGWITAIYNSGEINLVDLRTVLKDAHLIKRIHLSHSVATISLHRILLSIVSSFYEEGINGDSESWDHEREQLLSGNAGFSPDVVDDYFDRWEDRFYLIHPYFPFMQDPSVVQTFSAKEKFSLKTPEDCEIVREALSSVADPVSKVYPDAITVADGKSEWQLPKSDILEGVDVAGRTSLLSTALLFELYAATATQRGARRFLNDDDASPVNHDTHCAAQFTRSAIGFMVEAGSLFKTLVFALSSEGTLAITENDRPVWEWDVNSYGFLGNFGKCVKWNDMGVASDDGLYAMRSAVNFFQLALIFIPTRGEDGYSDVLAPIYVLRRLLFDFKHLEVPEEKEIKDSEGNVSLVTSMVKMPFPRSWNPFVAITPKGKAFKQTDPLSQNTALSRSSIFRVALLPRSEDFLKPQPLLDATNDSLYRAIKRSGEVSVRVFVHASNATQDKNFADFTFETQDFSDMYDDEFAIAKIEDWLSLPTGEKGNIGPLLSLAIALRTALGSPYGGMEASDKIVARTIAEMKNFFWAEYYELFRRNVTRQNIVSVYDLSRPIMDMTLRIFNEAVDAFEVASPFIVAKARNTLTAQMYKKFKREGKL